MRQTIRRWCDDRGAAAVEYAVLLALIAVVCVGGLTYLGSRTDSSYRDAKLTAALETSASTTSTTAPQSTTTTAPSTSTTEEPTTPTTKPHTPPTTKPCKGKKCEKDD